MTCERARGLMDDLVDGRLTPTDEADLREHVASCPGCSSELARVEAFCRDMMSSFREARPPEALGRRVLAALPDVPPRRALGVLARHRWLSLAAVAAAGTVAASYLIVVQPPAGPTTLPETPLQAQVEGAESVASREEVGSVAFGAVELRPADGEQFLDADAGRKLYAGDVVRTGAAARAELALASGARVILDAHSEVVVAPDASHPHGVRLARGQLFAEVEKGGGAFSVVTRLGVVRTLGTEFCVDLGEEDVLAVTVAEGTVQVDREGEREVVTAGTCWLSRARGAGCERGEACRKRLQWVEQFRRRRRGGDAGDSGPGARGGGRERQQGRRWQGRGGQSGGAPKRLEGARRQGHER